MRGIRAFCRQCPVVVLLSRIRIEPQVNRSRQRDYARRDYTPFGAGAPRSRPSVLKSSSISGQWMP